MKSKIKDKLEKLLSDKKGFTEAEVVYILVELGKYYERDKVEMNLAKKQTPEFINFFRNWAVHGLLDWRGRRSNFTDHIFAMYGQCPSGFYHETVCKLIDEINNSDVIKIPDSFAIQFKNALYSIIVEVPLEIPEGCVRLIAREDGVISKESIP